MSAGSNPRGAYPRGTWSYDGSLEELMLLAHRAFGEGSAPQAVANALAAEGELFGLLGPDPLWLGPGAEPQGLEPGSATPRVSAEKASSELRSFSGELFDMVMRIWMSEEGLELPLLRLCASASARGGEILRDFGDPDLRAVAASTRRVMREIERLKGLARFSPRRDGLFSAPLEPDYNVAAALVPHFARRFVDEDFAIVDLRRGLAFSRRSGSLEAASGAQARALLPDSGDAEEEKLWRRYFAATENPARRNPELQRRLMPRRYWRFLPELAGQ